MAWQSHLDSRPVDFEFLSEMWNVVEDREQLVVFLLRYRIVFVIMTLRTGER